MSNEVPPDFQPIAAAMLEDKIDVACSALLARIHAMQSFEWSIQRLSRENWTRRAGLAWDRVAESRDQDSPLFLALVYLALELRESTEANPPEVPLPVEQLVQWLLARRPASASDLALDALIVIATLCTPGDARGREHPALQLRGRVPAWTLDLAAYGWRYDRDPVGSVDIAKAIAREFASSWRLAFMAAKAIVRAGEKSPAEHEVEWFEEASRRASVDPVDALAARMHEGLVYDWSMAGLYEDACHASTNELQRWLAMSYLAANKYAEALDASFRLEAAVPEQGPAHPFGARPENLSFVVRARALAGLTRFEEADREFKSAIDCSAPLPPSRGAPALPPLSAPALSLERAAWWTQSGRVDEAVAEFARLLREFPLLEQRFIDDSMLASLVDTLPGIRTALSRARDENVPHLAVRARQDLAGYLGGESDEATHRCRDFVERLNIWRDDEPGIYVAILRFAESLLDDWRAGLLLDAEAEPRISALAQALIPMIGRELGLPLSPGLRQMIGEG